AARGKPCPRDHLGDALGVLALRKRRVGRGPRQLGPQPLAAEFPAAVLVVAFAVHRFLFIHVTANRTGRRCRPTWTWRWTKRGRPRARARFRSAASSSMTPG